MAARSVHSPFPLAVSHTPSPGPASTAPAKLFTVKVAAPTGVAPASAIARTRAAPGPLCFSRSRICPPARRPAGPCSTGPRRCLEWDPATLKSFGTSSVCFLPLVAYAQSGSGTCRPEGAGGNDSTLAEEVRRLLAAEQKAGDFLSGRPPVSSTDSPTGPSFEPAPSLQGRRLGPYRLLAEIGHGGMGSVYRAVRDDDQYQKQVAIKLIRGGWDSSFVRQRFKAERQILANLEHPAIARLIDGGTTEEGWPYFSMEYVEGEPIDRYCD